jgi:hypothetical protein
MGHPDLHHHRRDMARDSGAAMKQILRKIAKQFLTPTGAFRA